MQSVDQLETRFQIILRYLREKPDVNPLHNHQVKWEIRKKDRKKTRLITTSNVIKFRDVTTIFRHPHNMKWEWLSFVIIIMPINYYIYILNYLTFWFRKWWNSIGLLLMHSNNFKFFLDFVGYVTIFFSLSRYEGD